MPTTSTPAMRLISSMNAMRMGSLTSALRSPTPTILHVPPGKCRSAMVPPSDSLPRAVR